MFAAGQNYAEIGRYLNESGIPTSKGGKWNKNSFHRIFSNRRYLGKYIYQSQEIDGGVPRIIDDELFAQAQVILGKFAQAPSRGKAKIEYLLSEKLENDNKELKDTIASERALQIDYSYADIRKWLLPLRTLDYSKIKNRRDLIDPIVYRVILYDDKMKILFHLKGN